ncbi:helix-turn-helix domain-containing protein [Microvirga sp. BT688]|uniref:helix-turn-helix domain-containing protein n=1 Tax=Microvirga sp. TaxID=1873136 RepID=UPI0016842C34|nr:helix-turn-helix domain-containing protein [Microvirga sp.]MBD2750143.1 helix-turn-helix domain-containing protein [Microvirga sp.]
MASSTIPSYALYGEVGNDHSAEWVHCEAIQTRSHLHNYRIQPHRHEQLFQILHLTGGTAEITIDGRSTELSGPFVIALPPMAVHGYTFSPDVSGTVVTLFESRLSQILTHMSGMRDVFRSVQLIGLQEHDELAQALAADMELLAAEFAGQASGRLEAIEARLLLILIVVHRIQGSGQGTLYGPGQRARGHAWRFRELVEKNYRSHQPVEVYANRLGLTPPHLNRICREHFGDTALGMVHQRIILEAKRYLTFTTLTAKEIALALGFEDPAYFTRFFKRQTGVSPLAFRAMQQNATA